MNIRLSVCFLWLATALTFTPVHGWAKDRIVMRMADNLTDRTVNWGALVEEINAEFTRAHPDVTLDTESYATQPYQDKIRLYATSGQLPDVMKYWSFPSMLKPLVDRKLAAELSYDEFKALNFVPGSLEANMYDGALYGIPTNSDFWVIYYNARLFKMAGVRIPATIEDLLASVPKFSARGIVPMSTDGAGGWPLSITFDNLAERISGEYAIVQRALDRKARFTDPPFMQAAALLQTWAKAGLFPGDLLTSDYGVARNLFGQEKAAMYLMGSWELGLATDPTFSASFRKSLGAFNMPALKTGKGTAHDLMAWFGGNYVVSAKSRHKDLGIEYLKFYFARFPAMAWGRQVVFPAQRVTPTAGDSNLARTFLEILNGARVTSGPVSADRSTPVFKRVSLKLVKDLVAGVLTPTAFTRALDDAAAAAAASQ